MCRGDRPESGGWKLASFQRDQHCDRNRVSHRESSFYVSGHAFTFERSWKRNAMFFDLRVPVDH